MSVFGFLFGGFIGGRVHRGLYDYVHISSPSTSALVRGSSLGTTGAWAMARSEMGRC